MSDPRDENNETPQAANDSAAQEAGVEIAREAAKIAALTTEVAEMKDRYLRAAAEAENIRRRADKEKAEISQYALTNFAKDLLAVLDNFSRALNSLKPEERAALPQSAIAVVEGVEATQRQLISIFERYRIKAFEAKGQRFNPNQHEAIAELPSDQPAGTVIEVALNGYMIGDRLLRSAMVAISSGPAKKTETNEKKNDQPPGSNVDTTA